MSHPYIPQGTPITVTIDGHWDGYHSGNEPYMTYPGHEGSPRAVHIPHGALVQTKLEEAEAVEFTVDKTPASFPLFNVDAVLEANPQMCEPEEPKPPVNPMRMDLDLHTGEWHHVGGEKCPEDCKYHTRTPADWGHNNTYAGCDWKPETPKLRTATDPHGCTLYELGPDRWIKATDEAQARGYMKIPFYGVPLSTLTDVTDNGEPLDYRQHPANATNSRSGEPLPEAPRTAEEAGEVSIRASLRDAGLGIPERFECSRCDDSDAAFCAEHTYWSTKNAEFQRFWHEFNATGKVPKWAKDTPRKPQPQTEMVKESHWDGVSATHRPRKPEPGDRVSTTLNDENGSTVVGEYVYVEQDAVHGQALIEGEGFLLRVRLSEVAVIEPARPVVPEEPEPCVLINARNDILRGEATEYGIDWVDEDNVVMSWAVAWENGPWYQIERGEQIS